MRGVCRRAEVAGGGVGREATLPPPARPGPQGPGSAVFALPVPPSPPASRSPPPASAAGASLPSSFSAASPLSARRAATPACPTAGLPSATGPCSASTRGRGRAEGAAGGAVAQPRRASCGYGGLLRRPRRAAGKRNASLRGRHHGGAAAATRRPQRLGARRLPQGHRPPAAPPPLRPQRDTQHRAGLRGDAPLPAVGERRRGARAGEAPVRGTGGGGWAGGPARAGAARSGSSPGGPGAASASRRRGSAWHNLWEMAGARPAPPRASSFCWRG